MSDVSTADASSRYRDRGVGRFFYSGKKQAADIARWRGLSRPLYHGGFGKSIVYLVIVPETASGLIFNRRYLTLVFLFISR